MCVKAGVPLQHHQLGEKDMQGQCVELWFPEERASWDRKWLLVRTNLWNAFQGHEHVNQTLWSVYVSFGFQVEGIPLDTNLFTIVIICEGQKICILSVCCIKHKLDKNTGEVYCMFCNYWVRKSSDRTYSVRMRLMACGAYAMSVISMGIGHCGTMNPHKVWG